ncbi:LOCUS_02490 [Haloferula helveola]|uniref:Small ribosomal subunit protein uS11 n=1 Tax=Haloferula helveola TaxID=490095 RepID=A0ABM7R6W9_9BACT|nr:LOCUS_02490 [Haloferula helveola]
MADEETKNEAPDTGSEEAAAAPKAETPKTEETPAAPAAEAKGEEAKPEDGGAPKKEEKRDIFAEIAGAEEGQIKIHKAKGSKNISKGIVHVTATFNNTIVSVTDASGNTIGWSSAGKMGFKGSRKSTAYAAQVVSQDACRQAMGHGLKEAEVRVKGPGSGRESAVRAVQALGVDVTGIRDVTPIPHNGCRPKKARRV